MSSDEGVPPVTGKRRRVVESSDDDGGGAPPTQEIHVAQKQRVEAMLRVCRTDSGNACLMGAKKLGYLGGTDAEPAIVFRRAAEFIKFLGLLCKVLPTCDFAVHVNGEDDCRVRFAINIARLYGNLQNVAAGAPLTLTFPVNDRVYVRVNEDEEACCLIEESVQGDLRLDFALGQRVDLLADDLQHALACARTPPKTDDVRFTVYRPTPDHPVGYVKMTVGDRSGEYSSKTIPFSSDDSAGAADAGEDTLLNPQGGARQRRLVSLAGREPYFDERLSVKYLGNLTSTLAPRTSICFVFTPNQPIIITVCLDEDGAGEVGSDDPNTVSMWIAPRIGDGS